MVAKETEGDAGAADDAEVAAPVHVTFSNKVKSSLVKAHLQLAFNDIAAKASANFSQCNIGLVVADAEKDMTGVTDTRKEKVHCIRMPIDGKTELSYWGRVLDDSIAKNMSKTFLLPLRCADPDLPDFCLEGALRDVRGSEGRCVGGGRWVGESGWL